jgi:uncharacterized protein YutE (UPF0331/DUF86 family)
MAALDRERIASHLAALDEAVRGLERHAGVTADQLARDLDLRWAVSHGLQLAIQNVLHVSAHVATVLGSVPERYRDSVEALGRLGVIDRDFAAAIADTAGLRNVLVHGYLALDLQRVAESLRRLDDFRSFAAQLTEFLRANPHL